MDFKSHKQNKTEWNFGIQTVIYKDKIFDMRLY